MGYETQRNGTLYGSDMILKIISYIFFHTSNLDIPYIFIGLDHTLAGTSCTGYVFFYIIKFRYWNSYLVDWDSYTLGWDLRIIRTYQGAHLVLYEAITSFSAILDFCNICFHIFSINQFTWSYLWIGFSHKRRL